MPKNIVIFSDGTGQEGGVGSNTNVYKLFNMVVDRDDANQIVFYDRGLGTNWFLKWTSRMTGFGISKNIKDCYKFIFDNYSVGDQIYLFGFSRGATTMRSLSGFIHYFGLLPKCRPELIDKAYRIYRISDDETRIRKAKEFLEGHHNMWCRVHFLGVWDTVAALGVPIKLLDQIVSKIPFLQYKFHNLTLSAAVEHARHALAIDEQRAAFAPVLWDPEIRDYQTLKQVWFAGVHTDVGGGYPEQDLSDNALQWMVEEATEKGLLIYPKHSVKIDADPNGLMHDSRKTWYERLIYRVKLRSWDSTKRGKPDIHPSVRSRTDKTLTYRPWILDSKDKTNNTN